MNQSLIRFFRCFINFMFMTVFYTCLNVSFIICIAILYRCGVYAWTEFPKYITSLL